MEYECFREDIITICTENADALQFERKKERKKKARKKEKKNKSKRRNGSEVSWLWCKCAPSAMTNCSVGTWEQSCKPLMSKEQSEGAGQTSHRLGNLPDISVKKLCQGLCCISGKIVKWTDFSGN